MRKLGKLPYKHDSRHFLVRDLISVDPELIPSKVDWFSGGANSGAMLNDQIGCCTVAALGHLIQSWTGNSTGTVHTVTDTDILAAYGAVSGYVPGDPDTDVGAYMADVLKYARQVGIGGHRIDGYGLIDLGDEFQAKASCLWFGGTYLGLSLPRAWQWMSVWDVADGKDGEPGSWGRHAVNTVDWGRDGQTVFTWGYKQPITWRAYLKYADEHWGVFSKHDWMNAQNLLAPNQFNGEELERKLAAL